MDFEIVWQNIVKCAGQTFAKRKGDPFTYQIVKGAVVPNTTGFPLARVNFEKAAQVEHLRERGPGAISGYIWGPSYVYAILADDRIRPQA